MKKLERGESLFGKGGVISAYSGFEGSDGHPLDAVRALSLWRPVTGKAGKSGYPKRRYAPDKSKRNSRRVSSHQLKILGDEEGFG